MPRAVSSLLASLIAVASVSCSTVTPITAASAGSTISSRDRRAIESLLPVLGIRHPIDDISPMGSDRYFVTCRGRRLSESDYEVISFMAIRRNGDWFAERASVHRSTGVILE